MVTSSLFLNCLYPYRYRVQMLHCPCGFIDIAVAEAIKISNRAVPCTVFFDYLWFSFVL